MVLASVRDGFDSCCSRRVPWRPKQYRPWSDSPRPAASHSGQVCSSPQKSRCFSHRGASDALAEAIPTRLQSGCSAVQIRQRPSGWHPVTTALLPCRAGIPSSLLICGHGYDHWRPYAGSNLQTSTRPRYLVESTAVVGHRQDKVLHRPFKPTPRGSIPRWPLRPVRGRCTRLWQA